MMLSLFKLDALSSYNIQINIQVINQSINQLINQTFIGMYVRKFASIYACIPWGTYSTYKRINLLTYKHTCIHSYIQTYIHI